MTTVVAEVSRIWNTQVYGFGSDRYQQLGLGQWAKQNPTCRHSPTYMSGLWAPGTWTGEQRVTAIAAGGDTSLLVLEAEGKTEIRTCGYGAYGSLGNGTWPHFSGTRVYVCLCI